jgi:DMSO/TMAO reductase YedYZ molybdopterin-dependent catalytic subunit
MKLFEGAPKISGLNSFGKPILPPGQIPTAKFPVLTHGPNLDINTKEWRFRVFGLVEREIVWTWEEFMRFPQTTLRADFHCVTTWSRFDDEWTGVLYKDLVKHIPLKPEAKFVMQHAYGGYTTNLSLTVMVEEDVMFAHTFNGGPLPSKHGGPMRVFTPRRYAWKGAKWINGLEFLAEDKPGFWEENGYSMTADPWKEERYREYSSGSSPHGFSLTDLAQTSDNPEKFHIGAEYAWNTMLFLRSGYIFNAAELGLNLGVGVRWNVNSWAVYADYAFADLGRFSSGHRFTVGLEL